jgi:protein gp37
LINFTHIGWAHGTQNFWIGCDRISPECAHCYIARTLRQQHRDWGTLYRSKTWGDPAPAQRKAAAEGLCYRVFTCSLSDFFHADADPWRDEAWEIIRTSPNLVWLILSKRPELAAKRLPAGWPHEYPNVWLDVSAGCRLSLRRMDTLRDIPVHAKAVRFLSAEPLLEDISGEVNLAGFGWVIGGGGSGGDRSIFGIQARTGAGNSARAADGPCGWTGRGGSCGGRGKRASPSSSSR